MKLYTIRRAIVVGGLFGFVFLLPEQLIAQDPPGPFPTPTPFPKPEPPYAIITYLPADSTAPSIFAISPCGDGVFALVALQPDQVVQVTVQYPTDQALELVNLEAPDGGILLPPDAYPVTERAYGTIELALEKVYETVPLTRDLLQNVPLPATPNRLSAAISANGTLSFTFIGRHDPGEIHITLRQGSHELDLQFWIFNQQEPNNPPAISPGNPYNPYAPAD